MNSKYNVHLTVAFCDTVVCFQTNQDDSVLLFCNELIHIKIKDHFCRVVIFHLIGDNRFFIHRCPFRRIKRKKGIAIAIPRESACLMSTEFVTLPNLPRVVYHYLLFKTTCQRHKRIND